MKMVLIVTSFFFVGNNAYNKVGVQPYCNIDSAEFTAQCNYESLKNCQSYLMPGEACMVNPDYPTLSKKIKNAVEASFQQTIQPAKSLLVRPLIRLI